MERPEKQDLKSEKTNEAMVAVTGEELFHSIWQISW